MGFSKTFERELNKMFRNRTHWLRRELGNRGAGKPPEFSRRNVNSGIKTLQEVASDALAQKLAKSEFNDHILFKKNYQIKGRGPDDKKKRFEKWFASSFSQRKGIIYAFWGNHGSCIYIGRTGSHGKRPSSHFDKYWFSIVKRVTVFAVATRS
ncbi:MAG: hypothetical protein WA672_15730, partial [Candidatus Angelobacter sp.]